MFLRNAFALIDHLENSPVPAVFQPHSDRIGFAVTNRVIEQISNQQAETEPVQVKLAVFFRALDIDAALIVQELLRDALNKLRDKYRFVHQHGMFIVEAFCFQQV